MTIHELMVNFVLIEHTFKRKMKKKEN